MRFVRAPAFWLVLLGGCNSILGIAEVRGGSDANPAGDAPTMSECGPLAPPSTVLGCAVITHVRADGTTTKTRKDMSRFSVAAYVADSSASGFRIISGTGSADGVVRIEDVPDGKPFYLRLQDPTDPMYPYPHYFETDQHDLDLDYVEPGRDDTPTTLDTETRFTLTGMSAWKATDFITAEAFNGGTEAFVDTSKSPPAAGATTVDATFNWQSSYGVVTFSDIHDVGRHPQLVDTSPAHGDDLWVLHTRQVALTDSAMRELAGYSILDYVKPGTATMTDGAPLTIAGAFQPAPPVASQQQFSANLPNLRNAFRDEDRYTEETVDCIRSANPGAGYGLVQGALASFKGTGFNGAIWSGETNLDVTMLYSDPFPLSWPQVMACTFAHARYYVVPGTTHRGFGYAYFFSFTPATDNYVWTVATHAPTNILVGGVKALGGGNVKFDGVTPVTMTWDPVPGVNHYEVRVLGATEGFGAVFDTAQTSIAMPADTFTKGHFYVFRVFAIQTSGDYKGGHLFEVVLPLYVARMSTGWFRFSSDCGNGNKDPGEECDPGPSGASTPTCDADCSMPMCGDGFVNPAANEQCDEAGDAPHCDSDCTPVVCGDGHWNKTIEECDDGNHVDGDGCSALCTLERCGNGTVDPPFEACDDKNRVNGDGCTAFCQPDL
jgi:cysteine-rich repeat protein